MCIRDRRIRDKMAKRVQDTMNEDCESAITDAKYGFISGALKETFTDRLGERAEPDGCPLSGTWQGVWYSQGVRGFPPAGDPARIAPIKAGLVHAFLHRAGLSRAGCS